MQSFIYIFRYPAILLIHSGRLPYQIWVSRLWGLPVPPYTFPYRFVSVALLKFVYIVSLSKQNSRQAITCLDLFIHLAQTLQSSQIVRAWTFL